MATHHKTKDFNTHIGEFLHTEFLSTLNLSQNALAIAIHVPSTTINKLVNGKIRLNIDLDLRLCKFFSMSEGFFLGVQEDLERKEVNRKIKQDLDTIIPYANREDLKAKVGARNA